MRARVVRVIRAVAPAAWLRRCGALVIAAACAGGAPESDSAASTDSHPGPPGATRRDTAGVADLPGAAFAGTTGRTDRESTADSVATMTEVRTATHATFERVVFEFRQDVPGYHVAYTAGTPAHCGSGDTAAVRGSAFLEIRLAPARAHEFTGERAYTTVRDRNRTPDFPLLKQLLLTCDFEANVTWVLGLDARRPYRVLTLENPPRVVLDVQGKE